jgi:hypothetical protein
MIRMKSAVLIALFMAFTAMADENEAAATQAGVTWLALVDSGKFGDSWDTAASVFKKGITREAWVKTVAEVRAQLGKSESRKLSVAQPLKDPPNAPAGDYIILQYTSNFANKNEVVETVVMGMDTDKRWRTSGYFVK